MFAKDPGKQQFGESVSVPEFEHDALRRVCGHVAFNIVPDVLVKIASEAQNDHHREMQVALGSETLDVHVPDLVEGCAKRLCTGIPSGPSEVSGFDRYEV